MPPHTILSNYKWGEIILGIIALGLIGTTIAFIITQTALIGKCNEHVPPENCNKPAGDFAIEPNSTSSNVENGCGVNEDEPCVFPNINNPSEAIEKCNSLENKCNRFILDSGTMTVVSLTGKTLKITGKNMYVRQNGVTYQGTGSPPNSYKTSNLSGQNTSVTTNSPNSLLGSLFNTGSATNTYSGSGTGTGY